MLIVIQKPSSIDIIVGYSGGKPDILLQYVQN